MNRQPLLLLQIFAIMASALLLSLTVASATTIRIFTSPTSLPVTTDLVQEESVNRQMEIIQRPEDITFTNITLSVVVNAASLAQTMEKVYLYKCKKANPAECGKITPQTFDTFADVELLWSDISERESNTVFPQIANIMTLVKLRDSSNRVSWLGFYDTFRRSDYQVFVRSNLQLQSLDLQTSPDLVQPIVSFIASTNMIPFSWVTSATFSTTTKLFALASDTQQFEQVPVPFQFVVSSIPVVSAVNKDFALNFPNTTSGIADSITLTRNPTFTPGDNICQRELGETSANSCFDCGCPGSQYCAVLNPQNTTQSVCRSFNDISLSVISAAPPTITACTPSRSPRSPRLVWPRSHGRARNCPSRPAAPKTRSGP